MIQDIQIISFGIGCYKGVANQKVDNDYDEEDAAKKKELRGRVICQKHTFDKVRKKGPC